MRNIKQAMTSTNQLSSKTSPVKLEIFTLQSQQLRWVFVNVVSLNGDITFCT